jgi:hypothetical protein
MLSIPLQWLCEVSGYWQELEHAVVYVDPEHPKHAQCVTCLVSMQALEKLGHFQFPGIVHRASQHEGMVVDEWHDNGPQDLVMVSLCIQIAIDKMPIVFLIKVMPAHTIIPPANMGHSVHNVDIQWPYTWSVVVKQVG